MRSKASEPSELSTDGARANSAKIPHASVPDRFAFGVAEPVPVDLAVDAELPHLMDHRLGQLLRLHVPHEVVELAFGHAVHILSHEQQPGTHALLLHDDVGDVHLVPVVGLLAQDHVLALVEVGAA